MRPSSDVLFGAVTVVVVLASGDPVDGSTAALDRALHVALGDRAEVVIRTGDEAPPADAQTFVARLEWADHAKRALLRTPNGAEREILFAESDAPSERGRTVGFALASMVPDELLAEPPAPLPSPSLSPAPLPRASLPTPAREAPPTERPKPGRRFSVELLGQGAAGIGGRASGLGGAVGARFVFARGLSARLAFAARLGEVPSAQATARVLAPSIGAAWSMAVSGELTVGARVDAILLHQYVSHFSADDAEPDSRGRFLPAAAARAEAALRLTESTSVMLAFGPEVAFGTTRLFVVGAETDRIPPLRLCGEVGVTVAF